jgi:hypothetical protein
MARDSSTGVVPALIVGGSILAGAWAVTNSLDRTADQLDQIKTGLAETQGALEQVASARPAPSQAPARRGPDPNKRYTIARNGAPAKGPDSAKVKIFEFSDFQ